jgi:hypothetical protein
MPLADDFSQVLDLVRDRIQKPVPIEGDHLKRTFQQRGHLLLGEHEGIDVRLIDRSERNVLKSLARDALRGFLAGVEDHLVSAAPQGMSNSDLRVQVAGKGSHREQKFPHGTLPP